MCICLCNERFVFTHISLPAVFTGIRWDLRGLCIGLIREYGSYIMCFMWHVDRVVGLWIDRLLYTQVQDFVCSIKRAVGFARSNYFM